LSFFLLSGCATEVVKPRPGVLEAKSCMMHMNQPLKGAENYLIQSCTNNGVWMVEERDKTTDSPIVIYDFVNRELTRLTTENEPISIDTISSPEKEQFLALQKELNKALLRYVE
jgi:hypothetical protein